MRRQHFAWTYLVLAAVLTIYGSYSFIYYSRQQKDIPVLGIVFFVVGAVMLLLFLILFIVTLIQKKKATTMVETKEPEQAE